MLTKQTAYAGSYLFLLGIFLLGIAADGNGAEQVVNFHQQPAQVGDQVGQKLAINLELNTTIVQSGQIAHQGSTTVRRRQDRLIEILEVAEGKVRRARVSFPHSRRQSPENHDPTQLEAQPVEGKSYLVERRGEQLLITDSQGAIPLQEEYEIVFGSVQTLGLPNPLARILLKRTLHVGDRVVIPQELAERIMGFGDSLGQVQKFELELKELVVVDSQQCARFETTIEIRGREDNPMEADMGGALTIQADTCRTLEAKLSGPLHLRAAEQSYQVTAEGRVKMAIRSHYGHSKR